MSTWELRKACDNNERVAEHPNVMTGVFLQELSSLSQPHSPEGTLVGEEQSFQHEGCQQRAAVCRRACTSAVCSALHVSADLILFLAEA